jgi:hypothetical protein
VAVPSSRARGRHKNRHNRAVHTLAGQALNSAVCSHMQAALKQSFLPTAVRWLPHGLGYFLNLAFTTVQLLKPCNNLVS